MKRKIILGLMALATSTQLFASGVEDPTFIDIRDKALIKVVDKIEFLESVRDCISHSINKESVIDCFSAFDIPKAHTFPAHGAIEVQPDLSQAEEAEIYDEDIEEKTPAQ